jgi:GTPase SAR1 family protein
MYDITNRESFEHVTRWVNEVSSNALDDKFITVIVGNKSDLNHKRKVTTEEGQQLAHNLNATFFESSTLVSDSIVEIFTKLTLDIYRNKYC